MGQFAMHLWKVLTFVYAMALSAHCLHYPAICPHSRPHVMHDKCYARFQLPQPKVDAVSTLPTGHNFISPGFGPESHTFYGMHVAVLRLTAHIYTSVAVFKFPSECYARMKDTFRKLAPGEFLQFQYNDEAIKLVDLVNRKDVFPMVIMKASGLTDSTNLETCNTKVVQVLELRRFSLSEPFPVHSRYLLFGNHHNIFIGHIAKNCYDFQQLVQVHLDRSTDPFVVMGLKHGLIIELYGVPGEPEQISGEIIDPVTFGRHGARTLEINPVTRRHVSFHFVAKKTIIFDTKITNIGCPSPVLIG